MSNFTVTTVGIVYNRNGEILITKRAGTEDHAGGVYSYPGGKLEYDGKTEGIQAMHILEENLRREIKEETDVVVGECEYLSSHAFQKQSGDKVVVVAFLCEYLEGTPLPVDPTEISEVSFVSSTKAEELIEYDIVKNIYAQAIEKLTQNSNLHRIQLGGMVMNDQEEFLLVRYNDRPDILQVPKGLLDHSTKGSWEAMEQELARDIFEQTGVEVADGQIPFTDQILMDKQHFNTLIQYFICRYKYGKAMIKDSDLISEIRFVHINDLDRSEVEEKDYLMLYKAHEFLTALRTS